MPATSPDWHISPHYMRSDWIGRKVDAIEVFEDEVSGWLLNFAKDLAKRQHGALAALMLCCSLFERLESIDQKDTSKDQSRQFFLAHAQRVFSALDPTAAEQLYTAGRPGLYHDAVIRHGLELSHDAPDDVKVMTRSKPEGGLLLTINPAKVVATLEQHFADWLENVKGDPDRARLDYIEKQLPPRQSSGSSTSMTTSSGGSTRSE